MESMSLSMFENSESIGICSKCIFDHYKQGHKILFIPNEIANSLQTVSKLQLKYIEKNKADMKALSDCKDKVDDYISNKNRLLRDIDSLKSFLLFQYMATDK